MITKQNLTDMFDRIKIKSKWDLTKQMLWGYFFISSDAAKLEKLKILLEKDDYRFVDLWQNASVPDNNPEDFYFWMHVEKIEIHTVNSLNKRNMQLYKLASKYNVEYDGMDVGPVPVKNPIS